MSNLVTIFGASGFVGRHTVRQLAKDGWRIRAVCRHPNLGNYLQPSGTVGQIRVQKGDVHDDELVAAALAEADAVVNLTGVSTVAARTVSKLCMWMRPRASRVWRTRPV